MGRNIFIFVERRISSNCWECIADDEKLKKNFSLYSSSTLFTLLTHKCCEGKQGVYQNHLKDWAETLSQEINNKLYRRLEKPLKDTPSLLKKEEFDYKNLVCSLKTNPLITQDEALDWINRGFSFLLADDIISNPNTCFWNWCTVESLEWAVKERYKEDKIPLKEDDGYLRLAQFMRSYEKDGHEVRMVYFYGNSASWLGNDKLKYKRESHSGVPKKNNYLLMYLLQNRAQDFIDCLEQDGNKCYMGLLSLYHVAHANELLLSDTDWTSKFMPIVETNRLENNRILKYLESLIEITPDVYTLFSKYVKRFAVYYDDEDFNAMLDGSLDDLIKKGYREIDCRLYEAGLKFKFREVRQLLKQGANPYVHISGRYSSEEVDESEANDVYSLYDDALQYAYENEDYGIWDCWKAGINGTETLVEESLFGALFQGAGCQLVVNIIRKMAPKA